MVYYVLFFFFFSSILLAEEDLGSINVIGTTPLPGLLIDKEDFPNSIQSLNELKIKSNLSKSIVDLMNENLSGVTVKDIQNGAFQKNLDYRGFTASPLLGEMQGIAVYLDGVRINESFGDTVQWELIPESAIKQVDLMSSNPAFGLNALGGAISLTPKIGLDYKNTDSYVNNSLKFGSYAYHSELLEYGIGSKNMGLYSSIENASDGGWRDHSDGKIKRIYMNLGLEKDKYDLSTSFLGASTDLNGNGVTPIELLEKDRKSVFTWPDRTSNVLSMFTTNASYYTENDSIISANIYLRKLNRNTFNADEVDAEECAEDDTNDANELKSDYSFDDAPLCGEDNSSGDYGVLLDQNGNAIESDDSIRKYGLINKTFTSTASIGATIQYDTFFEFKNIENKITAGISHDQSKTLFRSAGFLGKLTNSRTVEQLFNSLDQPIELVAEQEHAGNGNDPDEKERGDVGPAEITGKTKMYGVYLNNSFELDDLTVFNASSRVNLAFVKLIDNFTTDTYDRTVFVNGDHRYFRLNPGLGFVRKLSKNFSLVTNYRESNRVPSPVELSCADAGAPCRLPNAFVADPPLEQVITRSLEMGVRSKSKEGNFNVNWDLIGHIAENTDDIIFVSSGTGLSSGFFENFGKTKRIGVDFSSALINNNKNAVFREIYVNYSFLKASFQSSHTLPAANHPNGSNDVEAGDIIPGMPLHKINARALYSFNKELDFSLSSIASSGVFLRGDESNQLKKTSKYIYFNIEGNYKKEKNINFFFRIDNLLDSKYETMGVLGEASASEVNVPISELGDTGSGENAIGALDPNFLSPGVPRTFNIGINLKW